MKILLIVPNYNDKKFYRMPIGIMYISSYLKKKGYDVSCLNLNHYGPSKLSEVLQKCCFDVVATGGLFTHIRCIRSVVEITRKHNPMAKIVLGGAIASGDPEFIMDELKPDFLVIGEGEISMDNLLKAINNNSDLQNVKGIAFKKKGHLVKTESTPVIEDLDQIPCPDYEGFEYEYYLDNYNLQEQFFAAIKDSDKRRMGFIVSTRDCIAKCTFCFRIMGGDFRNRSLENLFGEIKYLVERYKINELELMDDMFAASKDRVLKFCETVKPMNLLWRCQVRVNMVDEDILKVMKEAGCYLISYGFESGSRDVLKSMKKGITPNLIEKAIRATIKAKITIQGNFIFGDPAETIETMQETINFGRKFKSTNIGCRMIAPYPGTVLYKDLKENGMINNLVGFYENPNELMNMTSLSKKEFLYLCRKVDFENNYRRRFAFAEIIESKKITQQLYELSVSCPHCGKRNKQIRVNFNLGTMIVCEHCYQRFFINMAEFRFGNISQIYQYYYLSLKRIILYNAGVHRLLFPLPNIIEKMAALSRTMVNLIMSGSNLLFHQRK